MNKTVLLSGVLAICFFLGTATGAFGGIEPSPWMPIMYDLQLFQQEIDAAKGQLAGAKPRANRMELTLAGSHENMTNLLQSLQAKVKGLQETRGQKEGVIVICNNMKPKLDSLDVSLMNFRAAIKRGDGMAAQGLLNEMGGTVKALEALIAK